MINTSNACISVKVTSKASLSSKTMGILAGMVASPGALLNQSIPNQNLRPSSWMELQSNMAISL
ncbi:MAG: hypothetical protein IPP42_01780 [Saprospiraceae bacterium]|nr:hypothetical protein [Saprospiraceae bacterium]